jgi:hypothetical protein
MIIQGGMEERVGIRDKSDSTGARMTFPQSVGTSFSWEGIHHHLVVERRHLPILSRSSDLCGAMKQRMHSLNQIMGKERNRLGAFVILKGSRARVPRVEAGRSEEVAVVQQRKTRWCQAQEISLR